MVWAFWHTLSTGDMQGKSVFIKFDWSGDKARIVGDYRHFGAAKFAWQMVEASFRPHKYNSRKELAISYNGTR